MWWGLFIYDRYLDADFFGPQKLKILPAWLDNIVTYGLCAINKATVSSLEYRVANNNKVVASFSFTSSV